MSILRRSCDFLSVLTIAAALVTPALAGTSLLTDKPDLSSFSQDGLNRVSDMLDREVGQGHLAGAIMLI